MKGIIEQIPEKELFTYLYENMEKTFPVKKLSKIFRKYFRLGCPAYIYLLNEYRKCNREYIITPIQLDGKDQKKLFGCCCDDEIFKLEEKYGDSSKLIRTIILNKFLRKVASKRGGLLSYE